MIKRYLTWGESQLKRNLSYSCIDRKMGHKPLLVWKPNLQWPRDHPVNSEIKLAGEKRLHQRMQLIFFCFVFFSPPSHFLWVFLSSGLAEIILHQLSEMECYQGGSVIWVSDEVGMQEEAFNEICWWCCWCRVCLLCVVYQWWLYPLQVLCCNFDKERKLKAKDIPWHSAAHWRFFFPGPSNHVQNAAENRMSCRVSLVRFLIVERVNIHFNVFCTL